MKKHPELLELLLMYRDGRHREAIGEERETKRDRDKEGARSLAVQNCLFFIVRDAMKHLKLLELLVEVHRW